MKNVDGIMVKAARQRKTVTALQQTKLGNMWLNLQDLAALDQAEQQQLDEETEAIAERERLFNVEKSRLLNLCDPPIHTPDLTRARN